MSSLHEWSREITVCNITHWFQTQQTLLTKAVKTYSTAANVVRAGYKLIIQWFTMGQADSYETINTRIALCDDV